MAKMLVLFALLLSVTTVSAITNAFKDPYCVGNRTVIVELFEWKWSAVAKECKEFLGPYGFCGAQVSPPTENRVVYQPNRPWWERYQPVSYNLNTRSGTEEEFKAMVKTCNENDVRIYADAVINQMTNVGVDGQGTGGSYYDGRGLKYPAVPYGFNDFNFDNCYTSDKNVQDYQNPGQLRNCRVGGLSDLKTGSDYVRGKIKAYLNKLIGYGVAGFRIDSAKHIWPGDMQQIVRYVDFKKSPIFRGYPFVVQEVPSYGGQPFNIYEYLESGRLTNFKFGRDLASAFRKQAPLANFKNFAKRDWSYPYSYDTLNFIDNHENQRGSGDVLTHKEPRAYKMATAFMLAHPFGTFARVMSSYRFTNNDDGPPHNDDYSIKDVRLDKDQSCLDGWVCEHRWRQIYNMVAFRNVVKAYGGLSNFETEGAWRISFSRSNKGFIAFNLDDSNWVREFNTTLPAGTYCDVISGNLVNGKCTGYTVEVKDNGLAKLDICGGCENSYVAIHIGEKVGSPVKRF